MKKTIKRISKLFLPKAVISEFKNQRKKRHQKRILKEWKNNGFPAPPPHIAKQMIIKEYQKKYNYQVFVETGTYLGAMVEAQKTRFRRVFSIELGADLYEKAVKRFENDKNITIMQGDSGKVLKEVLLEINNPAVFWLDGHYSAGITAKGDKECPIFEELNSIFNSKKLNHILLIDDARCFNGEGDYPTIQELTEYIRGRNDNYQVEIKHDIIRYVI